MPNGGGARHPRRSSSRGHFADGGVCFGALLAGKVFGCALNEHIEDRHEERRNECRGEHAADDAGADRAAAGRSGPAGNCQRQDAEDEGQRRHDDRPEAELRGFDGRIDDAAARSAKGDAELRRRIYALEKSGRNRSWRR